MRDVVDRPRLADAGGRGGGGRVRRGGGDFVAGAGRKTETAGDAEQEPNPPPPNWWNHHLVVQRAEDGCHMSIAKIERILKKKRAHAWRVELDVGNGGNGSLGFIQPSDVDGLSTKPGQISA